MFPIPPYIREDAADLEKELKEDPWWPRIGLWTTGKNPRPVKAIVVQTKFGTAWRLHDDEVELITKRGKPWLPTGRNSRVLKQLGLQEAPEMVKTRVSIHADRSGYCQIPKYYACIVAEDKWGEDVRPAFYLIDELWDEGMRDWKVFSRCSHRELHRIFR